MNDQLTLRDRIADAIGDFMARECTLCGSDYDAADAVLAILPTPIEQAAVYRSAWHSARQRARVLSDELTRRAPLNAECAAACWEAEAQRLALSEALGLGTGAPWDAIRVRAADVDRLQNKILELEAELATVKDLLRTENKRANDAIDREEIAEQAALEAQQDRAVVLREAAARYEQILAKASPEKDPRYWTAVRDITLGLRRMADEAQQAEEARR